MELYIADESAVTSANPLEFWKQNRSSYPNLTIAARKVFCIQASSAASERDFSQVGLTLTARRARLKPKSVEAIELVKCARQNKFI